MSLCAIIADDLTGASDTGIKLLEQGIQTDVAVGDLKKVLKNHTNGIAINTDTRDGIPDTAYQKVKELVIYLQNQGINPSHFYKKIDSVFRGNIGQEIDGMLDGLGLNHAFIISAIPKNGRVIHNGILQVGVKTGDTWHVTQEIDTIKLLEEQSRRKVGGINLTQIRGEQDALYNTLIALMSSCEVIVFDTGEEGDFERVTRVLKKVKNQFLLVGAAGMASYLNQIWELQAPSKRALNKSYKKNTLLVAGSYHEATRRQLRKLIESNSSPCFKLNTITLSEENQQIMIENIHKQFIEKEDMCIESNLTILSVDSLLEDNLEIQRDKGGLIGDTIGKIAKRFFDAGYYDKFILTGGDTANKYLEQLDIQALSLVDEIIQGIPIGKLTGDGVGDLLAVTKSGGFGDENAFLEIIQYLDNENYKEV